jgi:hypothetical protein
MRLAHDVKADSPTALPAYAIEDAGDAAVRSRRPLPRPTGAVSTRRALGRRHVVIAAIVAGVLGAAVSFTVVETSGRSGRDDVAGLGTEHDPRCRRLIEIGAAALGVDVDSYARVVAAVSVVETASYETVVQQDLSEALEARERATPDAPRPDFTGVQGTFAGAIVEAGASGCPGPTGRLSAG